MQKGGNVMAAIKEGYLYDPVAKKLRKATDEEYVRQEILVGLTAEYGYLFDDMETEYLVLCQDLVQVKMRFSSS